MCSSRLLLPSGTNVTELGPLAACTSLLGLFCSDTLVADLGPLAACTALRTLYCSDTAVVQLGPLAACQSLASLTCGVRVPLAQVQMIKEACRGLKDVHQR